jgi:hypothetical protein
LVLINWAWSYFTYQRHARVILGGVRPPRSDLRIETESVRK